MATVVKPELETLPTDRQALVRLMEEINAKAGIFPDPDASIERLRELMRRDMEANGLTPEDNIGSRELMRMRYGDDWDKE